MQQPPNDQPLLPNTSYPSNSQWPPQPPSQPLSPSQYSQYPLPPPYYPPPYQQPPKKKSNLWIILTIIGGVLVLSCVICSAVGAMLSKSQPTTLQSTSTQTTQNQSVATTIPQTTDTPAPTSKPTKWTTIQMISGNGDKKTGIFVAPGDWKMLWSCQGFMDGSGIDGSLSISVYDSSNNLVDWLAVDSSCKAGGTSTGETEEHQGGSVYLKIIATGNFSMLIQELK